MALPVVRNIAYQFGDTFDDFYVVWLNDLDVPINLTGYTATMRIKAKAGGGTAEATVLLLDSAGATGLVINAAAGTVTPAGTPTKMKSGTLEQGVKYTYDLQVANVQETKTLMKGQFWVMPEVTTD